VQTASLPANVRSAWAEPSVDTTSSEPVVTSASSGNTKETSSAGLVAGVVVAVAIVIGIAAAVLYSRRSSSVHMTGHDVRPWLVCHRLPDLARRGSSLSCCTVVKFAFVVQTFKNPLYDNAMFGMSPGRCDALAGMPHLAGFDRRVGRAGADPDPEAGMTEQQMNVAFAQAGESDA
jgi:hypothetical protein